MNEPKLRFPEFTDDWKSCKVSEVAEKTFGGGTPKTSNETFWIGDIPWIQSSDLVDGNLFDINPKKYISQEAINKSAAKLVPENSIAVVTRVGVGKLMFIPFSYATSQDFLSLSGLKTEPQFTSYSLYKRLQQDLCKVQGTSIKGITKDELLVKEIMVPSYEEQKKIGECLHSVDTLIQSAEKELEGYRELKQGMLQKMFPKKGEKVPEIRFPEFTGDWEQRKLAEITKTTIGEFVIKTKQSDSYPYPVFNGGVSNTGFYCDFNNEGNKILVSARGANAGYVNIVKTRYWAGNSCYSVDLINKNEFNTDFIYQEMKRNQTRFTQNQQAANIPSVSKADVENFVIDVPSYDEQKRIAGYFENLDNLIVSQQQELDGYKELKKGLLQQMFC